MEDFGYLHTFLALRVTGLIVLGPYVLCTK